MVVPPDGGWGWVVTVASFFSNCIVDGILFSYGVYMEPLAQSLNESKATVSIVGSLVIGFYLMAGPLVSAMANRYGFRKVTIAGSVVCCASFIISSYATSILFLCISYGFIGGIGFGMIFLPSILTVGFYFDHWRPLAMGIAVCGSGVGNIIMPPFMTKLIQEYGWRGSLLVLGGMIIQCSLCGLMYRPLKPVVMTIVSSEDKQGVVERNVKVMKYADDPMSVNVSTRSIGGNINIIAELPEVMTGQLWVTNSVYPTVAQALTGSTMEILETQKISLISVSFLSTRGLAPSVVREVRQGSGSIGGYQESIYSDDVSIRTIDLSNPTHGVDSTTLSYHGSIPVGPVKALTLWQKFKMTMKNCGEHICFGRIEDKRNMVGVRPFYRDDIFYQSTAKTLKEYIDKENSLAYHMSVTRLPTMWDIREEEEAVFKLCPEAVRRTLATMLDMSLLKSPSFLVLGIGGMLAQMGLMVPFMFLKDRAMATGTTESSAVWLISVIGIASTFSRVAVGLVSSIPHVNNLLINNVALTTGGLVTMFSSFCNIDEFLLAYAVLFGITNACFQSLRSIITVELLGLSRLTNAFGLLMLFQGIAAATGSPLAGAFMELTGSYSAAFYMSGALMLASGIMGFPLGRINLWEKRKEEIPAEEVKK